MIPWSASRLWAISSPTTYDGRVYVRMMRNDNASTNAVNATRCDPCASSQFEYGTSDAIVQGPAITYILLTQMTPTQHGQRRISTRTSALPPSRGSLLGLTFAGYVPQAVGLLYDLSKWLICYARACRDGPSRAGRARIHAPPTTRASCQ